MSLVGVVGVMAQHAADEHARLVADKVAQMDADDAMKKEEVRKHGWQEEDAATLAEQESGRRRPA